MNILLQPNKLNKKAVSEMVGYVLLIIIAVGLSVLVFQFILVYIPKGESPECKKDINLIIQDYSCADSKLSLILLNKGLFRTDVAYIRFGDKDKKVLPLINDPNDRSNFGRANNFYLNGGLNPGESFNYTYSIKNGTGIFRVEVQAGILDNRTSQPVPCKQAVVSQLIECK